MESKTDQYTEHYFVVRGVINGKGIVEFDIDSGTADARFQEGCVFDGSGWTQPKGDINERDIIIAKALRDRIYS